MQSLSHPSCLHRNPTKIRLTTWTKSREGGDYARYGIFSPRLIMTHNPRLVLYHEGYFHIVFHEIGGDP